MVMVVRRLLLLGLNLDLKLSGRRTVARRRVVGCGTARRLGSRVCRQELVGILADTANAATCHTIGSQRISPTAGAIAQYNLSLAHPNQSSTNGLRSDNRPNSKQRIGPKLQARQLLPRQ
jgi:hypothetical protein